MLATVEERLQSRLVPQPRGCLEWGGYRDRDGYGQIGVAGKVIKAHRLAWTLKHGPIPPGIKVLHHCDNPPCCETEPSDTYPEGHLFIGTAAVNSADMAAKGRAGTNGNEKKTHCPANHEYTTENTYYPPGGGRSCRTCNRINHRRRYIATLATSQRLYVLAA